MIASRLVDLLRHGETEGGACFRGWRDDPLSEAGWAQLEQATSDLQAADPFRAPSSAAQVRQSSRRPPPGQSEAPCSARSPAPPVAWERILCSPAQRCAAFAEALGQHRGLPVERHEAFRERGFGAWEGKRADQIPADALACFWADPSQYDPPDAEPFADFRQRVVAAWQALVEDAAHSGEGPTLLITHGGVIRVILGEVLGLADARLLQLEVPPACRTRLRLPIGEGRPSLVSHGG
jgi:broad specificity phosphatase PhoE